MLGRARFAACERSLAHVVFSAGMLGCGASPRQAPAAPIAPPSNETKPAPPASAPTAPPPGGSSPPGAASSAGRPCGELGCLAFPTPGSAFEYAISSSPRIVALGESHAQKDAPNVKSATRRFAEELLPGLEGRAKALVIELLVPDGSCDKAVERDVTERQKPVTEAQAESNQHQYVTLGFVAKKHGIAPHALVPECDELSAITQAGTADIERMLAVIADATVRETEKLLASGDPNRAVLLYGGALHNDLEPRPGRESWSYAARLSERVGGRYVEVDLVIPEYAKPTPAWQAFPWYAAFQSMSAGGDTILFNPSPRSYVLIFPRSAPPPVAPAPP